MRLAPFFDRRRKFLAGLALGGLSLAIGLALYRGGLLEPFELRAYDQLCRLNAAPPPDDRIVLVAVDQGSLEAARNQGIFWPWPRQMYAPIVQLCTSAGARAVVFDILFTEPSSYGMEDDRLLASALEENGRAFLPVFLSREAQRASSPKAALLWRMTFPLEDRSSRALPPYSSAVLPIPLLAAGAAALGNVQTAPDPDGTYRRLPLVFPYRKGWVPTLSLQVLSSLSPKKPARLEEAGLALGNDRIPLDRQGNFLLTFYGPDRDFRRFSAFNVIQSALALKEGKEPAYPLSAFRDKFVFIGFTAPGLFDLKPTPLHSIYAGTSIHATLLANLLAGDFRVRLSRPAAFLLLALVAVGVAVTVLFVVRLWQLSLLILSYAAALLLFLHLAFRQNIWGDGVLLGTGFGLAFALSAAFSYATEGRQRRQIKETFSRYMSDLLIQDLLKHPEKVRLGGEKQVLTVFFSDLAGFTSIAERLAPEEVVTLLNLYLTAMTNIILERGGLIDKYEGDAIMAFWGAPLPQEDHALRACWAALENQSRLAELRREFEERGLPPVYARIGLNSGEMIIGNLGSSRRFDFTVIGDNVNLASRLEGASKEYGTAILISEETRRLAGPDLEVREIDWLRVKGKELPVRIFELLSKKGGLDGLRRQVRDLFQEGLELYRGRRWAEARTRFREALSLLPEDGPSRTFLRRCEDFLKTPPPADWDGVFQLTQK
ncbi:MAG: adenylate/guanylate cyclase domain-containing protein [Deltaproteobacteria bacterium]|nr:adenylate/guanylate cyclase domain-containing protein [Deltaproteobacteria bacterium]